MNFKEWIMNEWWPFDKKNEKPFVGIRKWKPSAKRSEANAKKWNTIVSNSSKEDREKDKYLHPERY